MASITTSITFAIFAGILPALIWLWFWLREDRKHPEPKRLIATTFFFGMVATAMALTFEFVFNHLTNQTFIQSIWSGAFGIIVLALIEEIFKYIAARRALHMPAFNEPIDAVIYLITAGLGFAALENALFLVGSFLDGGLINGFVVGNMRFLGATLLHSVTSAVVGIAIAFSYFRKQEIKVINTFLGIILATLLHAIFNFYIIRTGGGELLNIFLVLWVFVLIIILLFERVKRIKK